MYIRTAMGHNISEVASDLKSKLGEAAPIAVLFFTTMDQPYERFGPRLRDAFPNVPVVGATTGGVQFHNTKTTKDEVVVTALCSQDDVRCHDFVIDHLDQAAEDKFDEALSDIKMRFGKNAKDGFKNYTLLIFSDAFGLEGDPMIAKLNQYAGMHAQIAGGMAGDNLKLEKTFCMHNERTFSNGLVGLALFTKKPIGIGVKHGWSCCTDYMNITSSDGNVLYELDGRPVMDVMTEVIEKHGDRIDPENPLLTLVAYEFGINNIGGEMIVRTPLVIQEDGGLVLAGRLRQGQNVRIVHADETALCQGAQNSIKQAKSQLGGIPCGGALVFSCAGRLATLGDSYHKELEAVAQSFDGDFTGFATYGEFARSTGRNGGFHNATVVSVAFPFKTRTSIASVIP